MSNYLPFPAMTSWLVWQLFSFCTNYETQACDLRGNCVTFIRADTLIYLCTMLLCPPQSVVHLIVCTLKQPKKYCMREVFNLHWIIFPLDKTGIWNLTDKNPDTFYIRLFEGSGYNYRYGPNNLKMGPLEIQTFSSGIQTVFDKICLEWSGFLNLNPI